MNLKLSLIISALTTLFKQLWLSISSVNFYQDVYKIYKGYGVKYIFTVSFISSIIYCLFVLNFITHLKDYFTGKRLTKDVMTVEYIINQLPTLYYRDNKITMEEPTPLYIYDENKNKIAAIDINNQLSYNEKQTIPIIFTSNKLIITAIEITDKKRSSINIKYSNLLGPDHKTLTNETIKKICTDILDNIPTMFIYILMPIGIIFRFLTILFEKSFLVLLFYILTNFFGLKSSIKACVRIVLFSSGIAVLLQPLLIIVLPTFVNITFFFQIFANFLLFLALLKIRNEKEYYETS